MRLVTPEQMAMMDGRTIDEVGMPGQVLMERAALESVRHLDEQIGIETLDRVVAVCGGGNNGGDGIAIARILQQRGVDALVVMLSSPASLQREAKANFEIAKQVGLTILDWSDYTDSQLRSELTALSPVDVWVDALLGTGLDRPVEGGYRSVVETLNEQSAPILSVDIPSGVSGASGQILGEAVDADWTATFGLPKLGHALYPGRQCTGELHVADIGIPGEVVEDVGTRAEWLDRNWANNRLSARPSVYHKGSAGRLLILAGSKEKTGAALLATRGARSTGAGLLTVGTWRSVVPLVAQNVNEAMAKEVFGVDDGGLDEALGDADSVAIGPGMGTGPGVYRVLEMVLYSDVSRAVFDADALTMIAREETLRDRLRSFAQGKTVVLTPHPGEMARLTDNSIDEILSAPLEAASNLASELNCHVVLKSAGTIICSPGGQLAVNRSGNPGMASGGVGDVLTGVIGARLAERAESPWDAICLSVYAHGLAGDRAAKKISQRGMAATDLAEELSGLWPVFEG